MLRSRKSASLLVGSALVFGVALGAISIPRILHAADHRGKMKHQGKAGDLCTTSDDCQNDLTCLSDGNKKQCTQAPRPMVPPPT